MKNLTDEEKLSFIVKTEMEILQAIRVVMSRVTRHSGSGEELDTHSSLRERDFGRFENF